MGYLHRFGFHVWNLILQDGNSEIAVCWRSVFVSRPAQQVLKGSAEWMRSRLVRRKRRSAAGEGGTVPLPLFLAENYKGFTHPGLSCWKHQGGVVKAHFAFHLAGVADYALGPAVHNSWRGNSFVITFSY